MRCQTMISVLTAVCLGFFSQSLSSYDVDIVKTVQFTATEMIKKP